MAGGGSYSWKTMDWLTGVRIPPHDYWPSPHSRQTPSRSIPHGEPRTTASHSKSRHERHHTPSDSSGSRKEKHGTSRHTSTSHRHASKDSGHSSRRPDDHSRRAPSRSRGGPTIFEKPEKPEGKEARESDMPNTPSQPGVPWSSPRHGLRSASTQSSTLVGDGEDHEFGPGECGLNQNEPAPTGSTQVDPTRPLSWRWSADLAHLCKHLKLSNVPRRLPYNDIDTAEMSTEAMGGSYFAFAADLEVPDVVIALSGQAGSGYEKYSARIIIYDANLLSTRIDSGPREGESITSRLGPERTPLGIAKQRSSHHAKVIEGLSLSDPRAAISETCGAWIELNTGNTGNTPPLGSIDKADKSIYRLLRQTASQALDMHELNMSGRGSEALILNQDQIDVMRFLEFGDSWRAVMRDTRLIWNRMEKKMGNRAFELVQDPSGTPSDYCGSCASQT